MPVTLEAAAQPPGPMMDGIAETRQRPRYAGFAPRLGALVLDFALFAIPFLLLDHWRVVRYPQFHLHLWVATDVRYLPLSV